MPRYFFHCEGAENFRDEDGTELPDLRDAQLQAIQQSGQILQDHAEGFAATPWWRVFITDAEGQTLFELKITASLSGEPQAPYQKPLG
jgi:hypothetical protein